MTTATKSTRKFQDTGRLTASSKRLKPVKKPKPTEAETRSKQLREAEAKIRERCEDLEPHLNRHGITVELIPARDLVDSEMEREIVNLEVVLPPPHVIHTGYCGDSILNEAERYFQQLADGFTALANIARKLNSPPPTA